MKTLVKALWLQCKFCTKMRTTCLSEEILALQLKDLQRRSRGRELSGHSLLWLFPVPRNRINLESLLFFKAKCLMAEVGFAHQYYAWIWESMCQKGSKLDGSVVKGGDFHFTYHLKDTKIWHQVSRLCCFQSKEIHRDDGKHNQEQT